MPNDPKLALVASVTPCNAKRGEVLAVWVSLLDLASQNDPRGQLPAIDPDQIGWVLEMEPSRVSAILDALKSKGCIDGNSIKAWDKRQPKREREDDSAERVRRHREKQKVTPVTPCNALEERRVEESRGDEKSQNQTLFAELSEIAIDPQSVVRHDVPTNENGKQRPKKIWYDEQHAIWYQSFWNHKGKADSRRAYEKAINRIVDQEHILYNAARLKLGNLVVEDRKRFEHTEEWESRSKMHPATWLNGQRWTDEVGPVSANQPKSKQQQQADSWDHIYEKTIG